MKELIATITFSDYVQIILTLIGFVFTGIQILKIRKVADAAKQASSETLTTVLHNVTLETITKIYSETQETITAIRGGMYERAFLLSQGILRGLIEIKSRKMFSDEATQANIQEISLYFIKLNTLLTEVPNGSKVLNITRIVKKISEHSSTIYSWVDKVKFE